MPGRALFSYGVKVSRSFVFLVLLFIPKDPKHFFSKELTDSSPKIPLERNVLPWHLQREYLIYPGLGIQLDKGTPASVLISDHLSTCQTSCYSTLIHVGL